MPAIKVENGKLSARGMFFLKDFCEICQIDWRRKPPTKRVKYMSNELRRTLAENGSLKPRADTVLRSLKTEWLHHEAHGLKNPRTTYQVSLDRVAAAWLKVFPLLSRMEIEVTLGREVTGGEELLGTYETLLHRLNEHVDACEEILRCLRPPINGKIHKFHWQFLDATALPGWKAFQEGVIKRYRDPCLAVLVNELKHASGHLTLCNASTPDGPICGFFLNGPHPGEAIGPNKKLHKPMGKVQTAFSFRRDMMMNFWLIYQIGEAVARCVEDTIQHDHQQAVVEVPPAKPSPEWARLCEECAGLKGAFFPDEETKERPIIVVPKDASSLSIKLGSGRRSRQLRLMDVKVVMTIKEGTPSYAMPYFLGTDAQARR
ncbi:hypothetical protein [Burkholderia cepacia]|uniref:hypothetical protein n=1 Tax=Burkholderia cepacia TaxID=292 RepID=UPI00398EC555